MTSRIASRPPPAHETIASASDLDAGIGIALYPDPADDENDTGKTMRCTLRYGRIVRAKKKETLVEEMVMAMPASNWLDPIASGFQADP